MRRSPLALLLLASTAFAVNAGLGEVPATVKRQTPLATTQGFFQAAHAGDYVTAAHYLELDHVKRAEQPIEGPRLARRLKFVLDRMLVIDLTKVSADPNGDPDRAAYDQLGAITVDKQTIPIRLRKLGTDADSAWVVSDETVRGIDRMYDAHGPPFGESLPELLFQRGIWGIEPWQWLGLLVVLALAIVLSVLIERGLLFVGRRMAKLTTFEWDDELVNAGRGPTKLPFFCAIVGAGTRFLLLPPPAQRTVDTLIRSVIILGVSWFLLRFLRKGADQLNRVTAGAQTEAMGKARGIQTQLAVLRRVFEIAIYVIGGALLLVQFEVVRNVGVSLLASAGIAGLVIGLAAQKSISALLAGIQLSITQPIRIGDTVNIEGEVGTIEEITLTFVIVRIWDLRRLVVPVTYFLDNRFQNWSLRESEMLGAVNLQVDWRVDLAALRAELTSLLAGEAAKLWDTRVSTIQVTESNDRTLTVRVLVSARTSEIWDLRCLVRERMVELIRKNPEWLPTTRVEAQQVGEGAPRGDADLSPRIEPKDRPPTA